MALHAQQLSTAIDPDSDNGPLKAQLQALFDREETATLTEDVIRWLEPYDTYDQNATRYEERVALKTWGGFFTNTGDRSATNVVDGTFIATKCAKKSDSIDPALRARVENFGKEVLTIVQDAPECPLKTEILLRARNFARPGEAWLGTRQERELAVRICGIFDQHSATLLPISERYNKDADETPDINYLKNRLQSAQKDGGMASVKAFTSSENAVELVECARELYRVANKEEQGQMNAVFSDLSIAVKDAKEIAIKDGASARALNTMCVELDKHIAISQLKRN